MTSLNRSVMCKPPWWFEFCFCRSSWLDCWLVLALYWIILVILLLQPFFFANFGVYPGLPLLVFPIWAVESILESQPRNTTPGKRAEKTCRSRSRLETSNAIPRKSLFHLRPEKINKFEYCNNLWKKTFFITQCGNWKRVFKVICMQCVLYYVYANLYVNLRQGINCYKSLPKYKIIIEDLDSIIQDFKTMRSGL